MLLHCALKLVSVKLSGLALPLPTLSFGFTKSFFFSFLALADLPIADSDSCLELRKGVYGVY